MRPFLISILFLFFEFSSAQDFTYPTIEQTGHSIKYFVPNGWTIIDSAFGDLNKDNLDDYAIVLQHLDSVSLIKSEDNIIDTVVTQPRILLILFRSAPSGLLYLVEQTNSFILNHDNPAMDDPFQSIEIAKGSLQIQFHFFYNMGGWSVSTIKYAFRYQNKQFALIGADNSIFNRASHDFEEYSYNFITKRRSLTKGNDNKKATTTKWKTVGVKTLKTFKTFKQPYTWEVERGIYL